MNFLSTFPPPSLIFFPKFKNLGGGYFYFTDENVTFLIHRGQRNQSLIKITVCGTHLRARTPSQQLPFQLISPSASWSSRRLCFQGTVFFLDVHQSCQQQHYLCIVFKDSVKQLLIFCKGLSMFYLRIKCDSIFWGKKSIQFRKGKVQQSTGNVTICLNVLLLLIYCLQKMSNFLSSKSLYMYLQTLLLN